MTDDKELEMLADRIAEKVLRGGMGERHGRDTASRPMQDFEEPAVNGPLAEIAKHIEHHTAAMSEVAAKLNAHADRVMGRIHQEEDRDNVRDGAAAKPTNVPAIDRIFIALGDLDRTLSKVTQAAGRNSTLA